jgi:hypothetical protein
MLSLGGVKSAGAGVGVTTSVSSMSAVPRETLEVDSVPRETLGAGSALGVISSDRATMSLMDRVLEPPTDPGDWDKLKEFLRLGGVVGRDAEDPWLFRA